jgi:hypothetical protein
MGGHNRALLRESGFDDAAIDRPRGLGVIAGTTPAEHGRSHDTGHAAGP